MNNKRVGDRLWGDVCTEWWDNFAKMCVYAWQTGWLSGGDVGRLRECSIRMGKAHLPLQWPKLLWSYLWSDHMYFFARKWRILSKYSCFAMEGSHRRLKRMVCNSGGLSLLRGHLGVEVVVDNHTIGDSLCREGWDVTKRSMRGQGPVTVGRVCPQEVPQLCMSSHNVSESASGGPRACGHASMALAGSRYLSWCTPRGGGVHV